MKTPVVIRDDYVMYLEWFEGHLWFHTDVFKWTPKIKLKFLEDLSTIQSLVPLPLIALVKEDNTKLAKFGEKLGWTKGNKVIMSTTNESANIYIWSK